MDHRSFRARILGGSALICSLAAAGPLFASSASAQDAQAPAPVPAPAARSQSGLNEIVVTAQRREENLQEVPIAIAAMTSETLESAGIDATNTLTQAVPSVQFSRSGPSGLFFIRGVGTTNASGGEEGSNAFYVDNVYIPDLAGTITNFNNIERIEVLKGPQGTLFGRNAFGGLVHVITKDPGDSLEVNAEGGYGNYETVNGKLYVAGPLTSTLGASVALTGQDQGKGWGYNATLNEEIRQEDYWGARGKLVWEPSTSAKITLGGDYYSIDDDTAISWALDEDYVAASLAPGGNASAGSMVSLGDVPSHTSIDQWGASLTGEFDLGFAGLTSITAVRDTDNFSHFDVDATPDPLLKIRYNSGARAYQQELRLASNDAGPLSWQVGAFYLRSKQTNFSYSLGLAASNGLGPDAGLLIDAQLVTDSYAGFGEVSYDVTPSTHVTAGLRYTKDTRELDATRTFVNEGNPLFQLDAPQDKISYGEWTYRLALRQDFGDNFHAYASYNRGFKAGTYSLQSPDKPAVDPMFIDAYEVGLKTELFNRNLRLNVAAYHYNISDYQVRSAAAGTPGSAILLNAASVKVDGIDVDFEASPFARLRLFGGFSIVDSRFSNFAPIPGVSEGAPFIYPAPAVCDAPGTRDPGTVTGAPTGGLVTCMGDATGNQTPMAPDFAGSLGFSYSIPVNVDGEVRLSALGSYNSGYYFESDENLGNDEYFLLNGSVEFRPTRQFGIAVWGKNLTDTKYFDYKNPNGLSVATARADPRTYGITIKYDY